MNNIFYNNLLDKNSAKELSIKCQMNAVLSIMLHISTISIYNPLKEQKIHNFIYGTVH